MKTQSEKIDLYQIKIEWRLSRCGYTDEGTLPIEFCGAAIGFSRITKGYSLFELMIQAIQNRLKNK